MECTWNDALQCSVYGRFSHCKTQRQSMRLRVNCTRAGPTHACTGAGTRGQGHRITQRIQEHARHGNMRGSGTCAGMATRTIDAGTRGGTEMNTRTCTHTGTHTGACTDTGTRVTCNMHNTGAWAGGRAGRVPVGRCVPTHESGPSVPRCPLAAPGPRYTPGSDTPPAGSSVETGKFHMLSQPGVAPVSAQRACLPAASRRHG